MKIEYESKKIEKICNDVHEMSRFFKNNKKLIENLQTLMAHLKRIENVSEFYKPALKGYNFEKITNANNKYSIRIIPKRRTEIYRMYVEPKDGGVRINIIKIDDHSYDVE